MQGELAEVEEDDDPARHAGHLDSEEMCAGEPCNVLSQPCELGCGLLEAGEERAGWEDTDLSMSSPFLKSEALERVYFMPAAKLAFPEPDRDVAKIVALAAQAGEDAAAGLGDSGCFSKSGERVQIVLHGFIGERG